MPIKPLACLLALLTAATPAAVAEPVDRTIRIFAASSLTDVLDEIGAAHARRTGLEVSVAAAGSGVLARQILQGAPADIFISAAPEWMDVLEEGGALIPGSRVDLLSNALVLIAPAPADPIDLETLPAALGEGRLALALPEAVPAGIYARQALETIGLWTELRGRLAPADSARAALAFVALGEAPFGIVFATDALAEPRVSIVARFPPDSHAPIRYPAALLSNRAEARAFLDTLTGPEASAIFAAAGFEVLSP